MRKPGGAEGVMSMEDVLGLLIGIGVLTLVIAYLTNVYRHPERFRWLELPQPERKSFSDSGRSAQSRRDAA